MAGSHPEIVGPPEIARPEIAQIHHQPDGITQKQNFRETPKGTAKEPKRGGVRELHRNSRLAATQERPTKHQGPNRQKKNTPNHQGRNQIEHQRNTLIPTNPGNWKTKKT